jgi:serine/threonine protein kinase
MQKEKLENGVSFQRADGFAEGIVLSIKNAFDRDPSRDIIKPDHDDPEIESKFDCDIKHIGNLQQHIKTQSLKDFSPLLQDAYVNKFFPAGSHILTVRNSNGAPVGYSYFVTNQDLIVRRDKYGKLACDVIDNADLVGSGGQATVYSISGSIKQRFKASGEKVVFEYGESKRIVKIAVHNRQRIEDFVTRFNHEADITTQCTHLNSRNSFFGTTKNGRSVAGMTLQRFGMDLLELINQDSDSQLFTIDDRFQLTILVLEALKKQIHQHNIVHRDIKSDNICAWYDEYKWHVDIIDLGGARYHNENDKKYPGTMMYAPFETVYHKVVNESSDIFSIGIVLALLWRDMHEMLLDDNSVLSDRELNEWKIPLNLFNGIPDLPPEFTDQIKLNLEKMLDKDQSARPGIDECIKNFKTIYQVYKYDKTESEDIAVSITANILAEQANSLFTEYADKVATADNIKQLTAALHTVYKDIPSPSGGSLIFAKEQNTYYLASCRSKEDFVKKTDGLLNSYQHSLEDLNKLNIAYLKFIDDTMPTEKGTKLFSDLTQHQNELTTFINKMKSIKLNLDTINTETAHMTRKLGKMQDTMKGLEVSFRLHSAVAREIKPDNTLKMRMMS